MRYYRIDLINPKTNATVKTYTSYVNGQTDTGALNVELDLVVTDYATPSGDAASLVRVWGISLQDIAQSSNFYGYLINVYAGMQKGLPLANPQQNGLIVSGYVLQAFGNWIGTTMTLDLIVGAGSGPFATALTGQNVAQNWKAGTQLSTAVAATLKAAFTTYQTQINISPNIVLANDEPGFWGNMTQYAQYLRNISLSVLNPNFTLTGYAGVRVILKQNTFIVYDGTNVAQPKQIAFTDLIGQPTWIASQVIQFNTVMRADISVGDWVKLPPGQQTTTANSLSQFRQGSVFPSTYWVSYIRHVGNFRQPDGEAWISTFDAAINPQPNTAKAA